MLVKSRSGDRDFFFSEDLFPWDLRIIRVVLVLGECIYGKVEKKGR